MGFRFRRSVGLFPGVRLNFSPSGVSATIGPRGAAVTVGPRGTYANLGLPGTGLSYRARLDQPAGKARRSQGGGRGCQAWIDDLGDLEPDTSSHEPIASAATSEVTSQGLQEFCRVVQDAQAERRRVQKRIQRLKRDLAQTTSEIRKITGSWWWRMWKEGQLPGLRAEAAALKDALDEREEYLEQCVIPLESNLSAAQRETLRDLSSAAKELMAIERIWDVTSWSDVDRVSTRSSASTEIVRKPVTFTAKRFGLFDTKGAGFCLENANGADLFLYPAFILVGGAGEELALIEYGDISVTYEDVPFVEEEQVPGDAVHAGVTWKKVNKDGSRDKRFQGNYEIPIVQYGRITMRSSSGIHEQYLLSSCAHARTFAQALQRHASCMASS